MEKKRPSRLYFNNNHIRKQQQQQQLQNEKIKAKLKRKILKVNGYYNRNKNKKKY